MAAEVGSKAPEFTLVNQDRQNVTLSQEHGSGNVVLAFFPGAFSGTCTKEFCNFRDTMSDFRNVNAKVLGISTDTFFALKAWDDQQKLGFPLLSDYNKEVINKYGVVNPDMIGLKNIAKRAVFVVDKGGVIRYREVLDDARNEPDYEKLNDALLQILFPSDISMVRPARRAVRRGLRPAACALRPRRCRRPRPPAERPST